MKRLLSVLIIIVVFTPIFANWSFEITSGYALTFNKTTKQSSIPLYLTATYGLKDNLYAYTELYTAFKVPQNLGLSLGLGNIFIISDKLDFSLAGDLNLSYAFKNQVTNFGLTIGGALEYYLSDHLYSSLGLYTTFHISSLRTMNLSLFPSLSIGVEI